MISVTETVPLQQPRAVGSDLVLWANEDRISVFGSELCPAMCLDPVATGCCLHQQQLYLGHFHRKKKTFP